MDENNTISDLDPKELSARVLHELLRTAARLAVELGVGHDELSRLLTAALYREVRGRSSTLKEAAQRLGISERSAERLSRQARETFVLPELAHHLPRRIEFLLGSTPMSEARLIQVLRDVDAADVSHALRQLVEDGRVRGDGARTVTYAPVAGLRLLPRDTWTARISALGSFGENLANAVWGRFFRDEASAFARTLSFNIRRDKLAQLEALYAEQIRAAVLAWGAEADADGAEDSIAMQLSLCWAPYEAMTRLAEPAREKSGGSP